MQTGELLPRRNRIQIDGLGCLAMQVDLSGCNADGFGDNALMHCYAA